MSRFKLFGFSIAAIASVLVLCDANAADAQRSGATGRTGSVSSARMPSIPTISINTIGNMTQNLPTDTTISKPPVTPPVVVPPVLKCPDGAPENSEYTAEICNNDVLSCINSGALPGGLNDLFNSDLRNSIVNGMGLCTIQIDKCIKTVRRNCEYVYRSSADVWIDFNSRKIQPEYYSFILRKTGLTPNQAENTCWLLDKNTFGSAFTAVANNGNVTSEYSNNVGAYNNQAGVNTQKTAPQGVKVNNKNTGVDGMRGHYARWDASTGTCLIRVAAYNKDNHITNTWLFGALGDDKPAEVWKAAGDNFACNKNLFGFSLMNNTSTTAVVGIGGGTVVGAGVGAIAGHGSRDFDCEISSQRKTLVEDLRKSGNVAIINDYMSDKIQMSGDMTQPQCAELVQLYNTYVQAKDLNTDCNDGMKKITYNQNIEQREVDVSKEDFFENGVASGNIPDLDIIYADGVPVKITRINEAQQATLNSGGTIKVWVNIDVSETSATEILAQPSESACDSFPNFNLAKMDANKKCGDVGGPCLSGAELAAEVARLGNVVNSLEILIKGEKSNMLPSIAIGAGVGAAAGGLATAITAFVEKNNISCHLGDGLDTIGFGKSYSIGSLKDFYVKWNLRVPDTILPTAKVIDCPSWKSACAALTDLNHCASAQINYKSSAVAANILIDSACAVSGSVCTENQTVAASRGVCKYK